MENFLFLKDKFPSLYLLGHKSEQYIYDDPNSSLIKSGALAENIVRLIYALNRIAEPTGSDNKAFLRIKKLADQGYLPENTLSLLHAIRKMRNRASHENFNDATVALIVNKMVFSVSQWFMKVYGDPDYVYVAYEENVTSEDHQSEQLKLSPLAKSSTTSSSPAQGIFLQSQATSLPKLHLKKEHVSVNSKTEQVQEKTTLDETLVESNELENDEKKLLASDLRRYRKQKLDIDAKEIKARSLRFENERPHNEKETRALIDLQLQAVGWEADTVNLCYANGTRPQKGRNIAIAEWPTKAVPGRTKGRVDYALFVGEKLVGLIEAKDIKKDVSSVTAGQLISYALNIRDEDRRYTLEMPNNYCVPFIFATNGRGYIEQCKQKSGIWYRDLRKATNLPRPLRGWMSPDGILEEYAKNIDQANLNLKAQSLDPLLDHEGLNLRKYQIDAILAVEDAIAKGQERILVAMATGTGKTRTILGLIYRLLKSNRFKRVLYLVDRNALGEQTQDVFKDVKLEAFHPLDELYSINKLGEHEIDGSVRVKVATVQSMIKRVLYYNAFNAQDSEQDEFMPGVNDYDLVIIDEAHRGYILDKELSEDERLYSDQRDYQSKYKSVMDYFSGVKIALTATPAIHTVEIFGEPVYTYSYRQAVIDGYLVDHDAPHVIKTELSEKGIKYEQGEEIDFYDPQSFETQTIELEDEVNFNLDDFNKKIIDDHFEETVLREVSQYIDPTSPKIEGKTLIYAVDDAHADRIVSVLQKIYQDRDVPSDAIIKITGKAGDYDQKRIQELIRRFKNETYPSIVVTVDLLTTGIDVPDITSLVFLRLVKSRILYEQMLGRATRLSPKIKKDHFNIYDAVGVCEFMKSVTSMKPVVQKPKLSFSENFGNLHNANDDKETRFWVDTIEAKLQRKKQILDDEALAEFRRRSGGRELGAMLEELSSYDDEHKKEFLLENEKLFTSLDNLHNQTKVVFISNKEDQLISHEQKYGDYDKADDYLESLKNYLKNEKDLVEVINILKTRPGDMDTSSLKNLIVKLDQAGYRKEWLESAAKAVRTRDQQMTLDLVGIIRNIAFDIPLNDHNERVHQAVNKVLNELPDLNKTQINWLREIEDSLIRNPDAVLNADWLDKDRQMHDLCGGFNRLNKKIFNNKLPQIITKLNDFIYQAEQKG